MSPPSPSNSGSEPALERILAWCRSDESLNAEQFAESSIDSTEWDLIQVKKLVDAELQRDLNATDRLVELIHVLSRRPGAPAKTKILAERAAAQAAHARGFYDKARPAYEKVIQAYIEAGDPIEAARVEKTLLDVLMNLGDYAALDTRAANARHVLEYHGQVESCAQLDINWGNAWFRRGIWGEARASYERALETLDRGEPSDTQAAAHLNLANVYAEIGEVNAARVRFRESGRLFRSLGRTLRALQSDYGELWLNFLAGRYGEVIETSRRVEREFATAGFELGIINTQQIRARCLLAVNETAEALDWSLSADRLARRGQLIPERVRGLRLLAAALKNLRRLAEAEARLALAADLAAVDGSPEEELSIAVDRLELVIHAQDLESLGGMMNEVCRRRDESRSHHEKIRASLVLFRAELMSSKFAQAQLNLDCARSLAGGELNPWYQCLLLEADVDLGAALNEHQRVLDAGAQALSWFDLLNAAHADSDFTLGLDRRSEHIHQKIFESCLSLGRHEEAFKIAAHRKKQRFDSGTRVFEGGRSDSRQETLRVFLSRTLNGEPPSPWSLEKNTDVVRPGVQSPVADVASGEGVYGARNLVRHLRDDECVVMFHRRGSDYVVFSATCSGPLEFHVAGPVAEVKDDLCFLAFERLRRHAGNPVRDESRRPERLYENLFTSWIDRISPSIRRLYIVPDETLYECPFVILGSELDGLAARFEVIICPYFPQPGLATNQQVSSGDSRRVLVAGAADGRAPLIHQEVDDVCRIWGADCTAAEIPVFGTQLSMTWDIIHLASHGEIVARDPARSGLRIGDSVVSFASLQKTRLVCQVLILTGCYGAFQDQRYGAASIGIVGAALRAGALCVIAALGTVRDDSALRFSTELHRRMKLGESPETAFRSALRVERRFAPAEFSTASWTFASQHVILRGVGADAFAVTEPFN